MNIIETGLPGVRIFEPDVYGDSRGFFTELWNAERYAQAGLDARFVQDNLSRSAGGVLRGLHFQNPNPQGKLVYVLSGEVFDVAVDVRHGSPNFGQWVGVTLSADNHRQLYIPEGFAHGFCVTSDSALFAYKCTALYDAAADAGVRWNDPGIGIEWPIDQPALSQKDETAPRLAELDPTALPAYRP